MYFLAVFVSGDAEPVARVVLPDATDVAASISDLIAAFPGCHRVDVYSGEKHLFSVDCDGKTHFS